MIILLKNMLRNVTKNGSKLKFLKKMPFIIISPRNEAEST